MPGPWAGGRHECRPPKTRLQANGLLGEAELGPRPEPADELGQGLEAAHPEDLLELGQRVEVLGPGVARGQGAAGRQLVDSQPGLQVIEQEAHLGLCPDPDNTDPQRAAAVSLPDAFELLNQVGALDVVQRQRVDDHLVAGGPGPLIHPQYKPRAVGAFDAMCPESLQVFALCRVAGVVPVADVDQIDRVGGQAARPVDQLRQRPRRRLRPEQTGCFPRPDVEQVGQWIVGADRVDEVPLQALGDQDRRHRRVSRPIAGCPGPAWQLTSAGHCRTVPLWGRRWGQGARMRTRRALVRGPR